MIIKTKANPSFISIIGKWGKWMFLSFILVGIIGWLRLNTTSPNINNASVMCDGEYVDSIFFITNGIEFSNGHTQSNELNFEGKYSSKLSQKDKYGMGYLLEKPYAGQKIDIEIWVSSKDIKNCILVAQGNDNSLYYEKSKKRTDKIRQWEKIELKIEIPYNPKLKYIKIYPYYVGKNDAYFDNLKVHFSSLQNAQVTTPDSTNHAELYLDKKALTKLKGKRDEALRKGILKTGDNDWVKGKWMDSLGIETDVKLRLKGDWTDHLEGNDWSFRIKFPADRTWNRMRTFSIQDPQTRYYLQEWLFHKALTQEDVISPRYDFFKFTLNEQPQKLYAYEEHFDKQIVEYRNRREGVIIKFDEQVFWDVRIRDLENDTNIEEVSKGGHLRTEIMPFKSSKVESNPVLKKQYEHARNLLYSFQYNQKPADQVFDIDRMAKYAALCEVFEAYHSFIWHNQRFYYNPITKVLEPIGFDGFTESGPFDFHGKAIFAAYMSGKTDNQRNKYYQNYYKNPAFAEKFYQYLVEYSSKQWIDHFFNKIHDESLERQKLLIKYNPEYRFDKKVFYTRANKIRTQLMPLKDNEVYVYENDSLWYFTNYYVLPIEVVGTSNDEKSITPFAESIFQISNRKNAIPNFATIVPTRKSKYLVWRIKGEAIDKFRYSPVRKWTRPNIFANLNERETLKLPFEESAYIINDNEIVILPGNYSISTPIVIPQKYGTLRIKEGVEIDLIKEAYILSYSNVNILGSKETPIRIISSDKSSQGFHVINANRESVLQNVVFDNLSNLYEGTWQQTGAVSFYESDVSASNITVSNNHCEDALNIVRSNIDIEFLNVNRTFSDGFDCDFCKGTLKNSAISNTGNDGLDFSGSIITVDNMVMHNIGDKGLSAGEEATIKMNNIRIDGALIAVASKDLSKVYIKNIDIKNCNKGFAAYQKKPEFGPAFISVERLTENNIKSLVLKEEHSKIEIK